MNKQGKEIEYWFDTTLCCEKCRYKYECEEGIDFVYDCPLEEEFDFESEDD